jgi:hypothetical protein
VEEEPEASSSAFASCRVALFVLAFAALVLLGCSHL